MDTPEWVYLALPFLPVKKQGSTRWLCWGMQLFFWAPSRPFY